MIRYTIYDTFLTSTISYAGFILTVTTSLSTFFDAMKTRRGTEPNPGMPPQLSRPDGQMDGKDGVYTGVFCFCFSCFSFDIFRVQACSFLFFTTHPATWIIDSPYSLRVSYVQTPFLFWQCFSPLSHIFLCFGCLTVHWLGVLEFFFQDERGAGLVCSGLVVSTVCWLAS